MLRVDRQPVDAIGEEEPAILPYRLVQDRQVRRCGLDLIPTHRIQVEALAHTMLVSPAGIGKRGRQLAQRGRKLPADPQIGKGLGDAEHEQRAHLAFGQPCQVGAVAVEQRVAALRSRLAVDRHPRGAERVDVAVDGPLGDLQLPGELLCSHPAAGLEEHQKG